MNVNSSFATMLLYTNEIMISDMMAANLLPPQYMIADGNETISCQIAYDGSTIRSITYTKRNILFSLNMSSF